MTFSREKVLLETSNTGERVRPFPSWTSHDIIHTRSYRFVHVFFYTWILLFKMFIIHCVRIFYYEERQMFHKVCFFFYFSNILLLSTIYLSLFSFPGGYLLSQSRTECKCRFFLFCLIARRAIKQNIKKHILRWIRECLQTTEFAIIHYLRKIDMAEFRYIL